MTIGNRYDTMKGAIQDARATMSAADSVADDLADIIRGRLRKVKPHVLADIKKELRDFNAHTGRWKT